MSARNVVTHNMKVINFRQQAVIFSKIFDVQNKKFITVSCTRCGYTELYKQETDAGWNILDFFIGN